MKKIMVLFFAIGLTLFVGVKTFAADTISVGLGDNQAVSAEKVSASNGFSGLIDTYHPENLGSNPYQVKNDLQLNLSYGPHGPGPGHDGGGGRGYGYGPPPELWVYTLIGIVVVELLTNDSYQ
jgi:hypothetical protein